MTLRGQVELEGPPELSHLTAAERAAEGKAARAEAPRSGQARLDVAASRDPIALLEAQARSRLPELVPIRYGRMLVSPLAVFRGAATVMANDLAGTPRAGPRVQLSGDAHLLNFGAFASPERDLVFDLNDFDETSPGPFECDVKRLAASFEIAGRQRNFRDAERMRIVLGTLRAYRRAMRQFAAVGDLQVWYARLDARAMVEELRRQHDRKLARALSRSAAKARAKDGARALAKLTREVDGEPRFVSEPPLIVPLVELFDDREMTDALQAQLLTIFRRYRRTLPQDRRRLLEGFRYVDLARRVVGIGAVGTRCWMLLLLGRDEHDPLFLQIKEAEASVLEPLLGAVDSRITDSASSKANAFCKPRATSSSAGFRRTRSTAGRETITSASSGTGRARSTWRQSSLAVSRNTVSRSAGCSHERMLAPATGSRSVRTSAKVTASIERSPSSLPRTPI
jgi:hypothetical protein